MATDCLDGALRVVQRMLIREAPEKNALMMLLGVFESDFSALALLQNDEFVAASEAKLLAITNSRQLFG